MRNSSFRSSGGFRQERQSSMEKENLHQMMRKVEGERDDLCEVNKRLTSENLALKQELDELK